MVIPRAVPHRNGKGPRRSIPTNELVPRTNPVITPSQIGMKYPTENPLTRCKFRVAHKPQTTPRFVISVRTNCPLHVPPAAAHSPIRNNGLPTSHFSGSPKYAVRNTT